MNPGGSEVLVLAGDIGGTHLSLALATVGPSGVRRLHSASLPSAEVSGLEVPLRSFLAEAQGLGIAAAPQAACIAAAGPVQNQRIELTNLPWSIDGPALSRALGFPVAVVNDIGALVEAALRLDPSRDSRVVALPHGDGSLPEPEPGGMTLVVGAGTGLGVGYGFRREGRSLIFPSEGGHVGLPIFDEASQALWTRLAETQPGPPGVELVVSGPGLARLLAFFVETGRAPRTPRADEIRSQPEALRPALISQSADKDPACALALSHFLATYARVCADLAIAFLPSGGLYLAGGVTARLAERFRDPAAFMAPFERNYRPHADALLRSIPLFLIRDYTLSLDGAAWLAADLPLPQRNSK